VFYDTGNSKTICYNNNNICLEPIKRQIKIYFLFFFIPISIIFNNNNNNNNNNTWMGNFGNMGFINIAAENRNSWDPICNNKLFNKLNADSLLIINFKFPKI
jgi:hypothetical protein